MPVFLIDFVLPLILLAGIPVMITLLFAPGISVWMAWPFLAYVLPDVGYSLLGIIIILLAVGSVKIYWSLKRQAQFQGEIQPW